VLNLAWALRPLACQLGSCLLPVPPGCGPARSGTAGGATVVLPGPNGSVSPTPTTSARPSSAPSQATAVPSADFTTSMSVPLIGCCKCDDRAARNSSAGPRPHLTHVRWAWTRPGHSRELRLRSRSWTRAVTCRGRTSCSPTRGWSRRGNDSADPWSRRAQELGRSGAISLAAVANAAAAALPPIAATLAPVVNATGVLVHMFPGTLRTPRRHGVTRRCTNRWNLAWWRGHEGAAGHRASPDEAVTPSHQHGGGPGRRGLESYNGPGQGADGGMLVR